MWRIEKDIYSYDILIICSKNVYIKSLGACKAKI